MCFVSSIEYPNKLKKGDKVAVLSSSFGAANIFPHVARLGEERLKEIFGLIPVRFDTSTEARIPDKERVCAIESAFTDNEIKAIFAYIGGDDQLSIINKLNKNILKSNPKPFFGYSDNTHLNWLLNSLGMVSYNGGCIMTELAMQGSMDEYTVESLNNALFNNSNEWVEIMPSEEFNEIGLDWSKKELLDQRRRYDPNPGYYWSKSGFEKEHEVVEGQLWGGCLESIEMAIMAGVNVPESVEGKILFFETSEEVPSPEFSKRCMYTLGIRGWLNQFSAVLVGRPKSWEFGENEKTDEEREEYKRQCREVIEAEIRKFNSEIPIIQNLDIGHTAPQNMVPSGGECRIDSKNKKIWFKY